MSNRSLKRLGLRENLLQRLNRHHLFTSKDVMSLTQLELMKILGITVQGYHDLMKKASTLSAPRPKTAFDVLKFRQKQPCQGYLKFSLGYFDDVLHGGLPVGMITEIVGPPGVGKTQICMMLSVLASLPPSLGGMDGNVIYIDTESAFSAYRVVEIAKSKFPNFYSEAKALELTKRIYIHQASSTECLKDMLQKLQTEVIKCSAKLVILDSMASLIRKEFDPSDPQKRTERAMLVAEYAAILKGIAETFMIPVIVTNQITTRPVQKQWNQGDGDVASDVAGESYRVVAALGTLWSHCVNTRLIAQFTKDGNRQILIAKSPVAPTAAIYYQIRNKGVVFEETTCATCSAADPSVRDIATRSYVTRQRAPSSGTTSV